jgi:hypothetical protein
LLPFLGSKRTKDARLGTKSLELELAFDEKVLDSEMVFPVVAVDAGFNGMDFSEDELGIEKFEPW